MDFSGRGAELAGWRIALSLWRFADAREAWEALQARGLAPADDARRSWQCATCCGARVFPSYNFERDWCPACERDDDGQPTGRVRLPPDLPTLASVASLGVGPWLRAEELARCARPGDVTWCRDGRRQSDADARVVSLAAALVEGVVYAPVRDLAEMGVWAAARADGVTLCVGRP